MGWPTTGLPLAETHTNAENTTTIHPLEHTVIGQVINTYVATIGQATLTGPDFGGGALPALFAPGSTIWSDGGWSVNRYSAIVNEHVLSFGPAGTQNQGSGGRLAVTQRVVENAGTRVSDWTSFVESDDGSKYIKFQTDNAINTDGTSRSADIDFQSDLGGWHFILTDNEAQLHGDAYAGQTSYMFDLRDSSSASVFQITPESGGKFGFAAASPHAQESHLTPLNESVTVTLITQVATLLNEERARINALSQFFMDFGFEAAS